MKIEKIDIELTTSCNSRCKFCPRTFMGVNNNQIGLKSLKRLLSPVLKDLKNIMFSGSFGDAIFYPNLLDILDFLNGVKVTLATNASVGNKTFWKTLASFPHVDVIFALDGLEKSHELYRKGIKFRNVIKNISIYINHGGNARAQMLLFRHNENEVESVKTLVEDMGGSIYYRISRTYDDEFQRPTNLPIKKNNKSVYCQFIKENYIYISSDGKILPCCNFNPNRFSDLFGRSKDLDKVYYLSKNDINIYKSTIEKALVSPLFSYIIKSKDRLSFCIKECTTLSGDKMFREIPTT